MNIRIQESLWNDLIGLVQKRWTSPLEKPILFALYTPEDDHTRIISYREITTVKVRGDYPDGDYEYTYPGIKALGFYPPKGTGKWFSGMLVAGDGIELSDIDKKWMVREQVYFRIKLDKKPEGILHWKICFLDFPEVPLNFDNL